MGTHWGSRSVYKIYKVTQRMHSVAWNSLHALSFVTHKKKLEVFNEKFFLTIHNIHFEIKVKFYINSYNVTKCIALVRSLTRLNCLL